MKARTTAPLAALVAGTLFLGACSGDVLSPTGLAPDAANFSKGSGVHFESRKVDKKVLGVGETAVYVFTIDPRMDNVLDMVTSQLELPKNAVCVPNSGYGKGTWTTPCTPETKPVTITATVVGTLTLPRVEFQPAMRFNPSAEDVQLYMYARHANADNAGDFFILYCPGTSNASCHDESKDDASLLTKYSTRQNEVFRKILHFSGYVVAENDGSGVPQ